MRLRNPRSCRSAAVTTSASAPFYYMPSRNAVYRQAGRRGRERIRLRRRDGRRRGDNVTIKNCSFEATTGLFAVQVYSGITNTTVTNDTFDGECVPSRWAPGSSSSGSVNVTNNRFIDTPADGVDCDGGGVISGNYFSGSGYSSNGQHPDAISVTNSTAPLSITNNFIDWTTNPDSVCSTNDCIRITASCGSVSNVTVTGNYLVGGTSCVDAGNMGGAGTFSNISIANNYLGFGGYFDFYPGPMTGVTTSGNVIFDYTNPQYAAHAWTTYLAAGLPTQTCSSRPTARTSAPPPRPAQPPSTAAASRRRIFSAAPTRTTSLRVSAAKTSSAAPGRTSSRSSAPTSAASRAVPPSSPTSIRPRTSSTSAISTQT